MAHARRRSPNRDPEPSVAAGDLAALLNEVATFRTALDTDLTIAAAAAEQGVPKLALSLLDGARNSLTELEGDLLARLDAVPTGRVRVLVPRPRPGRTSSLTLGAVALVAIGSGAAAAFTGAPSSHPGAHQPAATAQAGAGADASAEVLRAAQLDLVSLEAGPHRGPALATPTSRWVDEVPPARAEAARPPHPAAPVSGLGGDEQQVLSAQPAREVDAQVRAGQRLLGTLRRSAKNSAATHLPDTPQPPVRPGGTLPPLP